MKTGGGKPFLNCQTTGILAPLRNALGGFSLPQTPSLPKDFIRGGLHRQVGKLCREFDTEALVFALHGLPLVRAQELVRSMLLRKGCCIIAEYRLAERNLDLPAVALGHIRECLTGGAHYAHYRAFMTGGALEGFVRASGFVACARQRAMAGAATVAVLKFAE